MAFVGMWAMGQGVTNWVDNPCGCINHYNYVWERIWKLGDTSWQDRSIFESLDAAISAMMRFWISRGIIEAIMV
jgi:hypothetical protein